MASMKRHLSFVILALITAVSSANQYYVGFEGSNLPENEPGWVRHFGDQYGEGHGSGDARWIETDPNGNNSLVIDGLASHWTYDYAEYQRQINPDPGEMFFAEWRLNVVEQYGYSDTGALFARDGGGTLDFMYYLDRIVSMREGYPYWTYPIAPGVFHTYRIESWDMVNCRLWIDDEVVRDGWWDLNSINQSYVAFGDGAYGNVEIRSLSEWDYFRFGVVPEPASMSLFVLMCVCVATLRR
jgi:hypothetical protein